MRRFLALSIVGFFLSCQTWAGKPVCYLHGILKSKTGKKPELSDMLRLHFDADNQERCRRLIDSYCRYNIKNEGYSPANLKGYFKPDGQKKTKIIYKLTDSCKITASDEE